MIIIISSCNASLLFLSQTENHWRMFGCLEVSISTEQEAERQEAKSPQIQNSSFLFVTFLWTVSREHLSFTSILTIHFFLALKLKSRNICQTYILHSFTEFLLSTELFGYMSHHKKHAQIICLCSHTLFKKWPIFKKCTNWIKWTKQWNLHEASG